MPLEAQEPAATAGPSLVKRRATSQPTSRHTVLVASRRQICAAVTMRMAMRRASNLPHLQRVINSVPRTPVKCAQDQRNAHIKLSRAGCGTVGASDRRRHRAQPEGQHEHKGLGRGQVPPADAVAAANGVVDSSARDDSQSAADEHVEQVVRLQVCMPVSTTRATTHLAPQPTVTPQP